MEKILLFQSEAVAQVKAIAAPLKIRVEAVKPEFFSATIGELAAGLPAKNALEGKSEKNQTDSLLVFCEVEDQKVDVILQKLRQKEISITYKAVMTDSNKKWNVHRMYLEMEAERHAFEQQMKNQQ